MAVSSSFAPHNTLGSSLRSQLRPFWLACAALGVAYAPVLFDLARDWIDDANYSHGFLIPFVSLYLIYQKRGELRAAAQAHGDARGLVVVALAMILYALGSAAAEYFSVRFSLIVALAGMIITIYGLPFFRRIWFEIGFLLFMIPIPYVIYYAVTVPLQLFATKVSMAALALVGAPAIREGNIIHLQGISLEVAEACSGIRSMVSLVAVGALWAYWGHSSRLGRALLFLSTVPIAIATNVARIVVTAILAYAGDVIVTEEPVHSIMGALVFVMAFIMFFIFSISLKKLLRLP